MNRAIKSGVAVFRQLCQTRKLAALCPQCKRKLNTTQNISSIYEPDNLNLEPDVPEYPPLNIHLRGYDFPVLESFAKYVNQLVDHMDFGSDNWAVPARTTHIKTYRPSSTNIEHEYNLAIYERTLQVENLPSTTAPLLFEVIQQNLPEGVVMTVKEPDTEEEEFRYVPDLLLQELHSQVEELDKLKEERKK